MSLLVDKGKNVVKAFLFIVIVVLTIWMALKTFLPVLIPLFFLTTVYLSLRFYGIDYLISNGFQEKYAMDFFVFTPVLIVFLFYLINSIPFRESIQYQIPIEDYKIVENRSRRGKVTSRSILMKIQFGDLDRKVKIAMPGDFKNNSNENIDYTYLQFESFKGLFGFYVVNQKTKKIYNW